MVKQATANNITSKTGISKSISLIMPLPHKVQYRKLAFEIFHLFAHHWKIQLNVVLVIADDSEKVKFKLVQHLQC